MLTQTFKPEDVDYIRTCSVQESSDLTQIIENFEKVGMRLLKAENMGKDGEGVRYTLYLQKRRGGRTKE